MRRTACLNHDDAGESSRPWQAGDRVSIRAREWVVVHCTAYADCQALRVNAAAGSRTQTFLLPFDRPRFRDPARLAVVSLRQWLRALETVLIDGHPYGGLLHFPATIDVIAYQLEPALAMLRDGHPRLLIADGVGLGKTIQAGLIIRELSERHDGLRVFVLVPAGLRQQWTNELSTRFVRHLVAADSSWLRTVERCLPQDVNPWSLPGVYLASFDFIKRPEALRPLEDVQWDLVVVDEAHGATITTDRRLAIDTVASRARRVILLTATPPPDASEFEALCRIGATSDRPIIIFQRARPAHGASARRSVMLAVRATHEEHRMHRLLERYTTLVWREADRHADSRGRLTSVILRKRALSSAASLEASISRRLELLANADSPPMSQLSLPLDDDEDKREDTVPDVLLAAGGLMKAGSEQRWLSAIRLAAEAAAVQDSKARVLVRLLSRIREPAIVFTEYRDTLERLRRILVQSNHQSCVLHGGLSAAERRDALVEFARGGRILLATDAAAEGLNLQHGCRVVVHYELPWNPLRMLQRAGRVDRIGQRRRVHEIALVASDTAESLVLAPLTRRATGRLASGETSRMLQLLTESRVAEAVFEGLSRDGTAHAASDRAIQTQTAPIDVTADAINEARRLQRRRDWVARKSDRLVTRPRPRICISVMRRFALPPGAVLLFDLTTALKSGRRVMECIPTALHVELSLPRWPSRPTSIKHLIQQILPSLLATVSPTLDGLRRNQLERIRPALSEALARSNRRDQEIANRSDSAARRLVQAGLFDRRTTRFGAVSKREVSLRDQLVKQPALGMNEPAVLISSADLRAVLVLSPR